MLFKNKQQTLSNIDIPILKLNNETLERVDKFLYLGIYLDQDLTWDAHVNHISNKISKNIGIIRRLKHTVPKNIIKILYISLINPHLNYGTLLWGYNLDRLEKLQKHAIRTLTHSYPLAHTSNLFKELKILKVEDIFILKQIIFYYKFTKNQLPSQIQNILTKQTSNLRRCHSHYFLKPPTRVNTECAKLCIRHSIPTLINNYDKTFIENINSLTILGLKNKFKKSIFDKYTFICTEANCYPCISRFTCYFGFSGILKYFHIFHYMNNFEYQRHFLVTGLLTYLNIFNYIIATQ